MGGGLVLGDADAATPVFDDLRTVGGQPVRRGGHVGFPAAWTHRLAAATSTCSAVGSRRPMPKLGTSGGSLEPESSKVS
jgi:hypothetical protein